MRQTFIKLSVVIIQVIATSSLPAQVIDEIIIENNEITKEWIILRELLVAPDDSIDHLSNKIQRSKENLYNTQLFNEVKITDTIIDGRTKLLVYVSERWYFWLYPIFEHADRNLATFIQSKQWDRVNYGLMLIKHNFRGRKENIGIKIRAGFRQQLGIIYQIPMLGKSVQKVGLYFDASLFRQKSYYYDIHNNRYIFNTLNNYGYNEKRLTIGLVYRPKHNTKHLFTTTYHKFNFPLLSPTPIIQTNTNNTHLHSQWLCFDYRFIYSTLDYLHYPTRGKEISLTLSHGYDLNKNRWSNATCKYQIHLPIANRLTYSTQLFGEIFFDKPAPVILRRSIGHNYYYRGYENYVWKAQKSIGNRQQISWNILKKRSYKIEQITSNKFNKPFLTTYLTAFSDSGFISGLNPQNSNMFMLSIGAGIDIISYYDIIFRVETIVNIEKKTMLNFHIGTAF